MTDDVTTGEIIRRLDSIQTTLASMQQNYVSRQELVLTLVPVIDRQTAQARDIDDLQQGEKDRVKGDRDWRRQITLVVLAFALTSLGGLAVGVSQLIG